jgi:hypothetical protein
MAMKDIAIRIGFWSAVLVTVLNVGSTISRMAFLQILSMALGFMVVCLFVIFMAGIHYCAPADRKILTLTGVAFAIACASLLGINYYMQLTVARWNPLPMLAIENPHSAMWAIEVLGYGFMGLATLLPAFIFSKGKLERSIRWLFIINAALGIGGIIGYAVIDNPLDLLPGLLAWDAAFPAMTLLLAIFFRRKMK